MIELKYSAAARGIFLATCVAVLVASCSENAPVTSASVIEVEGGGYLVDHDMVFSTREDAERYVEHELRRSSGARVTGFPGSAPRASVAADDGQGIASTRAALTVRTLDGEWDHWPLGYRIRFCVEDNFGSYESQFEVALAGALESWQRRAGVYLERVDLPTCGDLSSEVDFNVTYGGFSPLITGGAAFFPSDSRGVSRIVFFEGTFTVSTGGRTPEGVVAHEFGHALGFRHEHIWLDPACTSEAVDGTSGSSTTGGDQLTDYDEMSVMHYPQCRTSNSGGYALTNLDHEGAIRVYGLNAHLIYAIL